MHQFFVEDVDLTGQAVAITGSDVNHIRNVLRMRAGEKIRVSSKEGKSYFCEIAQTGGDVVTARILNEDVRGTELASPIYLFQGLPKGDKMELIVQKAVELGAAAVIPVAMKNCVVKLDKKKACARRERWQGIAESAAKQAKRSVIPQVTELMDVKEALRFAAGLDVKLAAYEKEEDMAASHRAVSGVCPGDSVGVWIGPEGGFAPEEIALAGEAGFTCVSLGRRILRTETAGLALLSVLMFELESRPVGAVILSAR